MVQLPHQIQHQRRAINKIKLKTKKKLIKITFEEKKKTTLINNRHTHTQENHTTCIHHIINYEDHPKKTFQLLLLLYRKHEGSATHLYTHTHIHTVT